MNRKTLAVCVALVTWVCMGCAPIVAQKGGRSSQAVGGSVRTDLEQPENPKESSSQSTYRRVTREIVLPAGSVISTVAESNQNPIRITLESSAVLKENIEEGASTSLGGSFMDTARALGARLAAMRPVQIAGIAMCIGALALFYFKWWLIGGVTLLLGGAMIAMAAVLPGHEVAVLIGGGSLFVLVVGAMLVAYFRGKDENRNHIPDFLERSSAAKPGGS